MTIYSYKTGSNQHVKTRKTSDMNAAIAIVLGLTVIAGMLCPRFVDKTTDFLKSIEFKTPQALVVAAEVSLPEKPDPTVVPKGIKTGIYEYLITKFGDHAGDAIAIIRTCENGTFEQTRVSGLNKNGTIDVGVMQINVDPKNTAEVEALKGYKYNIDRGYAKWLAGDGGAHRKSFYLWTCAKVINQYNYVDAMNGR